jgi:hypothetical protein
MSIFATIFCKHKWKTHTKKVYEWYEKIDGSWDKTQLVSETIEILICDKCGKLKKIKY